MGLNAFLVPCPPAPTAASPGGLAPFACLSLINVCTCNKVATVRMCSARSVLGGDGGTGLGGSGGV